MIGVKCLKIEIIFVTFPELGEITEIISIWIDIFTKILYNVHSKRSLANLFFVV